MVKDLIIAFSLANLCFIKAWNSLLGDEGYSAQTPSISSRSIIVTVVNVLLLGGCFYLLAQIRRTSGNRIVQLGLRIGFLVILLIPLNGTRVLLTNTYQDRLVSALGKPLSSAMIFVSVAVSLVVILKWHNSLVKYAKVMVTVITPLILILFGQAGFMIYRAETTKSAGSYENEVAATAVGEPKGAGGPRILWFLFDEMDQRISFDERPPSVQLPELDKLRSESLYADHVSPPSNRTSVSMPALITGRMVSETHPASPSELLITFSGASERVPWSRQPNLFTAARKLGQTTAIVGWYHPYCRVLGDSLSYCYDPHTEKKDWTLVDDIKASWANVLEIVPLAKRFSLSYNLLLWLRDKEMLTRRRHLADYEGILEEAKKVATDPKLKLILVHWPVPHPPGIYDRKKKDYSMAADSDYLDNLALVDRVLGEMRQSMAPADLWDKTTILVTADHWWRAQEFWKQKEPLTPEEEALTAEKVDRRVPFLLKLAGQHKAIAYHPEFNNIVLHDLLLSILRGEVTEPSQIVGWLDQRRTIN